jgi:hypothetical protein
MEQPECSETSAYKTQTPGNYPEESIKQEIYSSPKNVLGCTEAQTAPYKMGARLIFRR